jgi:hypothetical protein
LFNGTVFPGVVAGPEFDKTQSVPIISYPEGHCGLFSKQTGFPGEVI